MRGTTLVRWPYLHRRERGVPEAKAKTGKTPGPERDRCSRGGGGGRGPVVSPCRVWFSVPPDGSPPPSGPARRRRSSPPPPPARRRSAPSPVGPSPPCRPRAARSRRPPARDAPAARRGPCGPVRGPIPGAGARPAGRSPPGERTKKPPAPVRGRGQGSTRDRAGVHAVAFAARASAPLRVANSAHRVTASGFSSIHASRKAHSAGSPEIPRVG